MSQIIESAISHRKRKIGIDLNLLAACGSEDVTCIGVTADPAGGNEIRIYVLAYREPLPESPDIIGLNVELLFHLVG